MKNSQKTTRCTKLLSAICFATGVFFHSAQMALAAPTILLQENFNNPLSPQWQVVRNQQWSNPQFPCLNKNIPAEWITRQGKLEIEIDGSPCIIDFAPTQLSLGSLTPYSITFTLSTPESQHMDRSFSFAWQNAQSWYDIKLLGDSIHIQKVIDGQLYNVIGEQARFPFQPNQTYPFTIEVTPKKRIVVKIGQQVVLDATDQEPFLSSNEPIKIAFRGSVGSIRRSVVQFDDLIITQEKSIVGKNIALGVPLFKQTDKKWASLEYDSAEDWALSPEMSRWGCAVSSMAMIMKYHGITRLPDGSAVTPETLNEWLKDQADGYFSGSLNWLAVTRLTRLINEKYGTPKLEFTRTNGTAEDVIALAKKDLEEKKPVILGNGDHFFVADGYNGVEDTLLIKDPAFNYQKLSQHKKEVQTIRRFTPSYTDLSYILAIVPKGLDLQVTNDQGQSISFQRITDSFADVLDPTSKTPEIEQILVQKPETGTLHFSVSQSETQPYEVVFYNYDVAGNVTLEKKTGTVGTEPETFELHYHKRNETIPTPSPVPAQPKATWKKFHQDVVLLIKLKQFTKPFVGQYIELLSKYAMKAPPKQQHFYAKPIELGLKVYKSFIKQPAYKYLQQQLKSLKGQTESPQERPKD